MDKKRRLSVELLITSLLRYYNPKDIAMRLIYGVLESLSMHLCMEGLLLNQKMSKRHIKRSNKVYFLFQIRSIHHLISKNQSLLFFKKIHINAQLSKNSKTMTSSHNPIYPDSHLSPLLLKGLTPQRKKTVNCTYLSIQKRQWKTLY